MHVIHRYIHRQDILHTVDTAREETTGAGTGGDDKKKEISFSFFFGYRVGAFIHTYIPYTVDVFYRRTKLRLRLGYTKQFLPCPDDGTEPKMAD